MSNTVTTVKRTVTGKKCKNLRNKNLIPAVISGPSIESTNLSIDFDNLKIVLKNIETANPFELILSKNKYQVIVKSLSRNPVSGKVTHVNFMALAPDRMVRLGIPIRLVGISPAVKNGWGVIMQEIHKVQVSCKPELIPSYFELNISNLEKVGDNLSVENITFPDGVAPINKIERKKVVVTVVSFQKKEVEETEELTNEGTEEEEELTTKEKTFAENTKSTDKQ